MTVLTTPNEPNRSSFSQNSPIAIISILVSPTLMRENIIWQQNVTPNEPLTWDLSHLDQILFSLSYKGMCYLRELRSLYGPLVLTKGSKSKIKVM